MGPIYIVIFHPKQTPYYGVFAAEEADIDTYIGTKLVLPDGSLHTVAAQELHPICETTDASCLSRRHFFGVLPSAHANVHAYIVEHLEDQTLKDCSFYRGCCQEACPYYIKPDGHCFFLAPPTDIPERMFDAILTYLRTTASDVLRENCCSSHCEECLLFSKEDDACMLYCEPILW